MADLCQGCRLDSTRVETAIAWEKCSFAIQDFEGAVREWEAFGAADANTPLAVLGRRLICFCGLTTLH